MKSLIINNFNNSDDTHRDFLKLDANSKDHHKNAQKFFIILNILVVLLILTVFIYLDTEEYKSWVYFIIIILRIVYVVFFILFCIEVSKFNIKKNGNETKTKISIFWGFGLQIICLIVVVIILQSFFFT